MHVRPMPSDPASSVQSIRQQALRLTPLGFDVGVAAGVRLAGAGLHAGLGGHHPVHHMHWRHRWGRARQADVAQTA